MTRKITDLEGHLDAALRRETKPSLPLRIERENWQEVVRLLGVPIKITGDMQFVPLVGGCPSHPVGDDCAQWGCAIFRAIRAWAKSAHELRKIKSGSHLA